MKNNSIASRIIGLLLVVLQAAASVVLIISILNTKILTGWLFAIVVAVLAVFLVANFFILFAMKKSPLAVKIISGILSVAIIIGSIFALRYTDAFNGFLNKVTQKNPETKQYSVLVKNSSEIQEINGLAGKSAGFLKTDEKAGNAEQYLQNVVKFEATFYDDIDTLCSVLSGDIVNAIVLESDRIDMLKEEAIDAIKDTRVIYTFEIELKTENAEISDKEVTKEPFILYISGTDSRAGVKATARSDVNIIAVVNPVSGKILLVSIPRDTYVQLHGTTGIKDKLTHAGVYGIDMSKDTIEDFLGINIDYTVKVSFDTVVKVVDELDGIEIESDTAMILNAEGKNKKCSYVVGKQSVDGDCALRFARERKSYTTGDRHRGENQQQVITAIINKLSGSKNYVLKLPEILNIAADSFETSLTRDDISSFIRMQLNDGTKWEVESISVDGAGSMQGTYSMGANRPLYVMLAYPESVENASKKIQEYLTVPVKFATSNE
ncbi:LCP family protein [Candidatus Saccharibacteria bacterium]|nr:LCP family protein [Candidatus Saccharibacteria bacterium]